MPQRSVIVHAVIRRGVRRVGCEQVIASPCSVCQPAGSVVHSGIDDSRPRGSSQTRIHDHNHVVLHTLGYRFVGPHEAAADHPYSQLFYVGRGALTVVCGGSSHELASHQACLIRPLESYRLSVSADTRCRVLSIGSAFGLSPARSIKDNSPWQRVDTESFQGLASGLDRVTAALETADRIGAADIRRFVLGMLARIIDRATIENAGTMGIDHTENLVDQMRLLLAQNADRIYGIKKLEKLLDRSDRHLARVFKDATGATIKSYHEWMRMKIAVDLIATTSLHVTDISNELGFDSIHSFSRRFKAVFKCSPLSFRQKTASDETAPKRQAAPAATDRSHLPRRSGPMSLQGCQQMV